MTVVKDVTYFTLNENCLVASFAFKNFAQALDFVSRCGAVCQKHNHHPTITMHDYRMVTISSCTHDAVNTVTDKDWQLVSDIESLYKP